jgi:hypothetical protein
VGVRPRRDRARVRSPARRALRGVRLPGDAAFDGRREYACGSPYQGADSTYAHPAPLRIACDMTAGASDGGWIGRSGRLVSVTSNAYDDDPSSLYGPFFGPAIRAFYASIKNG